MDYFTKQRSLVWLVVVLVVLNVTTLVLLWARPSPRGPAGPPPGPPRDRAFVRELNLTSEQESRFDKQREEYFQVIGEYDARINSKKHDLMEALFQEEPDGEKLNALADELGQLYAEMEKARYAQILEFKSTPTDTQFNIFKRIVDEACKPRPEEMDRGGPPHRFDAGPPGDTHGPVDR